MYNFVIISFPLLQVALYVSSLGSNRRASSRIESPFCGATLIAPTWLVTAAHCLSELVPHKDLPVGQIFSVEEEAEQHITARLGDHVRGQRDGAHETTRTVEMAIIHPEYRRGFSEQGFDVALLKLDEPVKLSGFHSGGLGGVSNVLNTLSLNNLLFLSPFTIDDQIDSICIPDRRLKLPRGHVCYAAGWGETSAETPNYGGNGGLMDFFYGSFNAPGFFGSPFGLGQGALRRRSRRRPRQPLTLLEVDLPLVPLQECRRIFRNLREGVHVCAGEKGKV